ncbi:MAG: type II toxin-antitoxin system RelE family toxin [Acidimicrobiales bacterium]
MSYAIEWRPSARKQIRRLDAAARRRVLGAIGDLSQDPRPAGSVSSAGSPGWRRIRVGGYRVVYDVRDDTLIVLVLRVGSRGDVYQRLFGVRRRVFEAVSLGVQTEATTARSGGSLGEPAAQEHHRDERVE